MADNRRWHVDTEVSPSLKTPCQIDVFQVHEEVGTEMGAIVKADRVQRASPVERRASARAEDWFLGIELADIFEPYPAIERHSPGSESVASGVKSGRIPNEQHLARETPGLRMPMRGLYQRTEPVVRHLGVIVEQRNERGISMSDPTVECSNEPSV